MKSTPAITRRAIKVTPMPIPASAPPERPECGLDMEVVALGAGVVVLDVTLLVVCVAIATCDVGEKPVSGMEKSVERDAGGGASNVSSKGFWHCTGLVALVQHAQRPVEGS